MSSVQTQILSAINSRITSVLPAYTRLPYSYDLEKNDFRTGEKGFGIIAGEASTTDGTTRAITLDQTFSVILSEAFGSRLNDSNERTAINTIYDNLETLYLDFFQSKLGIPSVVLLVNNLSLDAPENLGDNVISVKMNFTVKHRKTTT